MGAADGQYQAALCSTWPAVADGEDDELSMMMAMGFFLGRIHQETKE